MKKKAVITVVALAAVLVLGYFGYRWLSEKYRPETNVFPTAASDQADPMETAPPGTSDAESAETPAVSGEESEAAQEAEPSEDGEAAAEGDTDSEKDADDLKNPEGDADALKNPEGDADALKNPEGDADVDLAPDFTVYDEDGEEYRLSEFFGKPVIVNFWATWCGPCRQELPHFNELAEEYGDRIQFLMVNLLTNGDTLEIVKSFLADNGYTFPVYYDKDLDATYTYGIYSIPVTIAVGKNGNLLGGYTGTMSREMLMTMITALLNE